MTCRSAAVALLFAACSVSPNPEDAGNPDAGTVDAGTVDAGTADSGTFDAGPDDGGFHDLFNGVDLSGWQKYLGSPFDGGAPQGVSNDPTNVFTVGMLDGEPAIHVSGETWGELISDVNYENFELTVEFKRGSRIYPPLNFFDSGIMYLSHGPYGAVNAGGQALSNPIGSGAFLVSMEFQIADNDVGDCFSLGPIGYTLGNHGGGPETSDGGWNQARIVRDSTGSTHFLNGVQTASATGFTDTWPGHTMAPLTSGKLQLQCEGSEIWFRHVRIRSLP